MNTSSPTSDWTVSTLHLILENLYRYGGPILIVLGTLGSIINLRVFVLKNLQEVPCYMYLIARNISNLLFIYLSLLYVTVVLGYDIFPSSSNLTYCHFSIYISLLCDILSPFYLILISIDRILVTSLNDNIRKQNTYRLACKLSINGTIFWILFHIHALIYSEIVEIKSNAFHCDLKNGLYSTIITYYTLIVKGILAPILLIIFSLWIMNNLKKQSRIQPMINLIQIKKFHFIKDELIFVILIKDILIYIIFSSIMSIVLMYELITEDHIKNFQRQEIEYFIRHLSTFCLSIPFCIGFYTNILVSKTFRNEVKNNFLC